MKSPLEILKRIENPPPEVLDYLAQLAAKATFEKACIETFWSLYALRPNWHTRWVAGAKDPEVFVEEPNVRIHIDEARKASFVGALP